jgi:transglutaminase-like putative cysteine protease
MVALVATNLAFVHITDSARLAWLVPLLALTLASPWLIRLTRFMSYRLLWNLSVLGAFALLVRHVTYAGAAFLLEDGLLLAALCQVHLVNNLSDAQKPDLLFFNSFLIAVVTSYLSVDLGYSLVLLVYAPLLVASMQLLSIVRAGAPETPGLVARATRSGALRGLAVLAVTLVVFLFFPRDFSRRGLLGESLQFSPPGGLTEVAFSEQVDLSQSGQVQVSDRVVMTVRAPGGAPRPPSHWRGAALDRFDGQGWRAGNGVFEPLPWCGGAGGWTRPVAGNGRTLEAYLVDPDAPRLFTPLEARRLEALSAELAASPQPDGNFRRNFTGRRRPVQYALELYDPRKPGGKQRPVGRELIAHVRLESGGAVPRRARELARELRRRLAPDALQKDVAELFRSDLAARFRYLAPGAEGGARSLDEFLEGRAGAHCEYFATALAVMLRVEAIPCRVVTGYRSEEWDEDRGVLTVRAHHAHAWVEVLDPEAGWMTVDPTPAVGMGAGGNGGGLLAGIARAAADLWAAVAGFNSDARDATLAWLGALPGRVARRPGEAALFSVALALVIVALRVRRRRREEPHARAYRRSLRKLKLELAPAETPRELLDRARRTAYPADGLRKLEVATAAHEQARYVL